MSVGPDLEAELTRATDQAWNALAHGKYAMFGYWAAWVVKLRKLTGHSHYPSPFSELVDVARGEWKKVESEASDVPTQDRRGGGRPPFPMGRDY